VHLSMFIPQIISFVCNWSLPQDMVASGPKGLEGHPKMHIIKVACVGRIDAAILIDTFIKGADGVLMVSCPSPDCHFIDGNVQAEHKIKIAKKLLALAGLSPKRLRLESPSPGEALSMVKLVDDFRNEITLLGPSQIDGKNLDDKVSINLLAARDAASNYRLRALTGREIGVTEDMNVYGERISNEQFEELLDEVVQEEFIGCKTFLLAKHQPLSVKKLAVALGMKPANALHHVVEMRRKGMIAIDHIDGTTPIYKALEAK
jgi:coenzyme F420-reducing hydrogenase delta subunit